MTFDKQFGGYRIFLGDLTARVSRLDIQEEFGRCGEIKMIWVARTPPGFAYVVFAEENAAEKAVKRLDGKDFHGRRIKVEHAVPQYKDSKYQGRDGRPRRNRPDQSGGRRRSRSPVRSWRDRDRSPVRRRMSGNDAFNGRMRNDVRRNWRDRDRGSPLANRSNSNNNSRRDDVSRRFRPDRGSRSRSGSRPRRDTTELRHARHARDSPKPREERNLVTEKADMKRNVRSGSEISNAEDISSEDRG